MSCIVTKKERMRRALWRQPVDRLPVQTNYTPVMARKLAAAFHPMAESSLPAGTTPPAGQEPKVTLERDGSRVTRIKVQCVCGHIIELVCE